MKIQNYPIKVALKHVIIVATVALTFASCKIGREYVRPTVQLPETLGDSVQADSASLADLQWKQIYTDTLLQQLIDTALLYNKDMLMAAARVRELAAMKRIDQSALWPQVGLRVYAEKEGDNYGGDAYDSDDQFDLKGVVSWELDLWGKLRWTPHGDYVVARHNRAISREKIAELRIEVQPPRQ